MNTRKVRLSVPGKTFLCGEYVALNGGPCVLISSEPRFELLMEPVVTTTATPSLKNIFHRDSPAGLLWQQHEAFLSQYHAQFTNPYSAGGWGGSSAEFLLLKIFLDRYSQPETSGWPEPDYREILKCYQDLFANTAGAVPSGADVVSQLRGGFSFFHREAGRISRVSWLMNDVQIVLLKTANKEKTHDHLRTLPDLAHFRALEPLCLEALQAIKKSNLEMLVRSLKMFWQGLISLGLIAENTQAACSELEKIDGVLVAKGCGARGADVIAVLVESAKLNSENWNRSLRNLNLFAQAQVPPTVEGLRTEVEFTESLQ